MNELNRKNLELASEWLCRIEEMSDFFQKVVQDTKSEAVKKWYTEAVGYNRELHYCLWRGISDQIVEEYNG